MPPGHHRAVAGQRPQHGGHARDAADGHRLRAHPQRSACDLRILLRTVPVAAPRGRCPVTTLFLATTGGHLDQLASLAARMPPDGPALWVTHENEQSRSLLSGRDVEFVPYVRVGNVPDVARCVPTAHRLWRERVRDAGGLDRLGHRAGLPALPGRPRGGVPLHRERRPRRWRRPARAGAPVGARASGGTPSTRTGPGPVAGLPAAASSTAYEPDRRRPPARDVVRVVVTVGTAAEFPFGRLIDRLAPLLPADGALARATGRPVEVLWQTGCTPTDHLPIDAVAFLAGGPADRGDRRRRPRRQPRRRRAPRSPRWPPACVPCWSRRSAALGEAGDDHQGQLADELQRRQLALHRDPEDLAVDDLLAALDPGCPPRSHPAAVRAAAMTAVLRVDPRTDPLWLRAGAAGRGAASSRSPPWITAVCDTYGFEPAAQVGSTRTAGRWTASHGRTCATCGGNGGWRCRSATGPTPSSAIPTRGRSSRPTCWPAIFRSPCGASDTSPALGDPRFTVVGEAAWHDDCARPSPGRTARGVPVPDPAQHRDGRAGRASRSSSTPGRRRSGSTTGCTWSCGSASTGCSPSRWSSSSGSGRPSRRPTAIRTALAVVDGRPVAGALYLVWQDTVYYKFGASQAEYLALRPNDALHWQLIRWAHDRGLRALDWGLSDLDQPGLVAYKRKWASTRGPHPHAQRGRAAPRAVGSGRADPARDHRTCSPTRPCPTPSPRGPARPSTGSSADECPERAARHGPPAGVSPRRR